MYVRSGGSIAIDRMLREKYVCGDVDSSPAVAGGALAGGLPTVYVGSDDDYVYALDAATGARASACTRV